MQCHLPETIFTELSWMGMSHSETLRSGVLGEAVLRDSLRLSCIHFMPWFDFRTDQGEDL